ncbi:MAG TPA: hypothetical protein VNS09_13590 [Solirubrobacter sp.]|nr:hypothetical protein [Solirubrobacter sp.]
MTAVAVVLACLLWTSAARAQAPVAGDFQKVTLDDNTQNPMELDIAQDGRVFYIERDGRLMIWKPDTRVCPMFCVWCVVTRRGADVAVPA